MHCATGKGSGSVKSQELNCLNLVLSFWVLRCNARQSEYFLLASTCNTDENVYASWKQMSGSNPLQFRRNPMRAPPDQHTKIRSLLTKTVEHSSKKLICMYEIELVRLLCVVETVDHVTKSVPVIDDACKTRSYVSQKPRMRLCVCTCSISQRVSVLSVILSFRCIKQSFSVVQILTSHFVHTLSPHLNPCIRSLVSDIVLRLACTLVPTKFENITQLVWYLSIKSV